jgi:YCII-related domain-containing protein
MLPGGAELLGVEPEVVGPRTTLLLRGAWTPFPRAALGPARWSPRLPDEAALPLRADPPRPASGGLPPPSRRARPAPEVQPRPLLRRLCPQCQSTRSRCPDAFVSAQPVQLRILSEVIQAAALPTAPAPHPLGPAPQADLPHRRPLLPALQRHPPHRGRRASLLHRPGHPRAPPPPLEASPPRSGHLPAPARLLVSPLQAPKLTRPGHRPRPPSTLRPVPASTQRLRRYPSSPSPGPGAPLPTRTPSRECGCSSLDLDLNGLAPTAQGVRVQFSGTKRTVIDGPFAEAKELIGGYWIIQVRSKEEAVEWAKRIPFGGAPGRARRGRDPADPGARGSAGEPRASGREEGPRAEGPRAAQALSDAAHTIAAIFRIELPVRG